MFVINLLNCMSKKQIRNKVIIFGGSHHNTLGVVRALGEMGINSYVVLVGDSTKDSLVLKSKYVTKGWTFSTHEEAVQHIFREFSSEAQKPVIIATSDAAASSIDQSFEKLNKYFFIPNGNKQEYLTYLMDKEVMSHLAKEIGLRVAKTWVIENKIITEEIEYPCITKPLSSVNGSKSDIKVCHSESELFHYLKDSTHSKIQVQKYIERDFEYQLIGCSLNGGQEVIIPGFSNILRSSETTNTGFLKYSPISDLKYDKFKSIEFIRACNYSGLFSLEFIRGKDGLDYFLEINFRNDGNAYSVTAAGVNLPYIWVASMIGWDISDELNNEIKPILVMPEFTDIYQVLTGKISLTSWIKDLKNTDRFLYYNKMDMKPFYYELRRFLLNVISKIPAVLYKKVSR